MNSFEKDIVPDYSIILIGEREDSVIYVNFNWNVGDKYVIKTFLSQLPESTCQENVEITVNEMNNNQQYSWYFNTVTPT